MAATEKDSVTGTDTTGHEWDGLKELNTPLPKWWLWTYVACVVWGVVWVVLYPALPGITGHFRGVLGFSTRGELAAELQATAKARAAVLDPIAAMPVAQVKSDPKLMQAALAAGRTVFAENCQPCHGAGGEGKLGYPSLADDNWIWGGSLDDIVKTLHVGIRSGHADARASIMPAFGTILQPGELDAVTDHVMALYGKPRGGADVAKGAELFAANCAACHGEAGQGNRDLGAPMLKTATHLYGDTRELVRAQIANPRMGVMPNWNTRLSEATIRAVAIYVHMLGGGE